MSEGEGWGDGEVEGEGELKPKQGRDGAHHSHSEDKGAMPLGSSPGLIAMSEDCPVSSSGLVFPGHLPAKGP